MDFSGFSAEQTPVTSAGIAQTCRKLRENIAALKRMSVHSSSSSSSRRLSLSPVLRDIQEARQAIDRNRRISRARILERNRRSSLINSSRSSPPFTRSRGKVTSLPFVQARVLERELMKKKVTE